MHSHWSGNCFWRRLTPARDTFTQRETWDHWFPSQGLITPLIQNNFTFDRHEARVKSCEETLLHTGTSPPTQSLRWSHLLLEKRPILNATPTALRIPLPASVLIIAFSGIEAKWQNLLRLSDVWESSDNRPEGKLSSTQHFALQPKMISVGGQMEYQILKGAICKKWNKRCSVQNRQHHE